jgi:hypothetical protein
MIGSSDSGKPIVSYESALWSRAKAVESPAASFCHFESVTDFTRGFLELVTD